ncbi:MAG: photosystem II S4 domain protein [Peptococcaceae bacterium]|nr:photosystem II S4 domain protein [Peptococcaceae bacterium]
MMIERERTLAHLRDGEERALVARALDLAEAVLRRGGVTVTDFYDPYHAGLVISAVTRVSGLAAAAGGGYPAAERVRVAIHPGEIPLQEADFSLAVLAVEGNFKLVRPAHRDFLGSILGLGLKRDKLGDIITGEKGALVVVAEEVAPFLCANLTRVGRVRVKVEPAAPDKIGDPGRDGREIRATVPSLRLDAVAAAGFGTSRAKIAAVIRAGLVRVNWRVCPGVDTPVREGDVISIRGRGRAEITGVAGPLKSGRLAVLIKRL